MRQGSGLAALKVTDFSVPFLNDSYAVQLTGSTTGETVAFSKRTTTGFTVASSNPQSTAEVC